MGILHGLRFRSALLGLTLLGLLASVALSSQVTTDILLQTVDNLRIRTVEEIGLAAGKAEVITPEEAETFSACLLVMDDNHRLSEWIGYHYHVLPLTYLVIAVDPRSAESPAPILERFRQELNMTIVMWHDKDYGDWEPLDDNAPDSELRDRHRQRQKGFLKQCMKHLADQGRTWTALWDTDEALVYNSYKGKGSSSNEYPSDLSQHGNVMHFLKNNYSESGDCLPIHRLLVGAKEISNQTGASSVPEPFDRRNFDTLRFFYRNEYGDKVNSNGKVMLNVQKVNHNDTVYTPHRPAMSICTTPRWQYAMDKPFLLNHYW